LVTKKPPFYGWLFLFDDWKIAKAVWIAAVFSISRTKRKPPG